MGVFEKFDLYRCSVTRAVSFDFLTTFKYSFYMFFYITDMSFVHHLHVMYTSLLTPF